MKIIRQITRKRYVATLSVDEVEIRNLITNYVSNKIRKLNNSIDKDKLKLKDIKIKFNTDSEIETKVIIMYENIENGSK